MILFYTFSHLKCPPLGKTLKIRKKLIWNILLKSNVVNNIEWQV
jgi:hypothetical protein